MDARGCAYRVVRRVFEEGAYADRALNATATGLEPRERALATQLVYGTVQRRATLDHIAQRLSTRPLEKLDPPVLSALRLGLFQLLYLGGVADHAAVNETVELVKRDSRGGAGLVNAVLRRAAAEARPLLEGLEDLTPHSASILHSVPQWLAEMWFDELGEEEARLLLRAVNTPAESALRVNTLVSPPAEVVSRLPVAARPAPDIPEGLILDAPFDAHGSELWTAGAIMPQSRASMLVARILAPSPHQRVLDLCAAPGGKTTHLAALTGDQADIVAVEQHPGRAQALSRTCRRMHVASVRVDTADAATVRTDGPFDATLVDPPCSGLGTLQSRPDLRWRVTPERIAELVALQLKILAAGAAATGRDGTLVYSVCTISAAESTGLIETFLSTHRDFELEHAQQLLPHRDRTDGFYIARLRRRASLPLVSEP